MRSLGGAFGRVSANATAFAHRDAEAMIVGVTFLPSDMTAAEVEQRWARGGPSPPRAPAPTSTSRARRPPGRGDGVPARHLARLTEVKRAYDPENVFALNHNVPP